MKKRVFKFLTLLVVLFTAPASFAELVEQRLTKTHLRWNVFVQRDMVVIEKKGDSVFIKSLNTETLKSLKNDLLSLSPVSKYFKKIVYNEPSAKNNNIESIEVKLASSNIELFNFYRDREKKYVVDFWRDADAVSESTAAVQKKISDIDKEKKKASTVIAPVGSKTKGISFTKKPKTKKRSKSRIAKKAKKKLTPYRDFRYGAAFIWDYEALKPTIKPYVTLKSKTPEYFYPIKNRNFEKGEKEAHLQLNLNLYRKKKWGLMYKSIKLFQEKYGEEANVDFNEYLKANAILRTNFGKDNMQPVKMAVSMFSVIAARTKNYDLKKGIYKYLLQYNLDAKDHISALELSKRLYVESKQNFDYEESNKAAEAILYNLSNLNQIEKIREILKEKTIRKLLPAQTMAAYKIYSLFKLGKIQEVLKEYEIIEPGLTGTVDPVIQFNAAEAYFREAKYPKAIKLFDAFISKYSYHPKSSDARLRIALSYDILGKSESKVKELYKNAIDRSQDFKISYEARLRYVGLTSVRKRKTNESDIETRIFMELEDLEKGKIDKELKKLLWLVRLRTFIVDKNYNKALSYLNAIPVTSLRPSEKRVFEADGAEIVYGLIDSYFKVSDYSNLVRIWEIYKTRYINKVAADPYLNFIVAKSYIKMGLYEAFDSHFKKYQKLSRTPVKTFPIWYDREIKVWGVALLKEMELIKNINLKNWALAKKNLNQFSKLMKGYNKVNYYNGIIAFYQKDYVEAPIHIETFLTREVGKSIFDPYEVAEMMRAYTDSLYQTGKIEKFKKVSEAVLNDTEYYNPNNRYMFEVRERIAYLNIELIAGKRTPKSSLILEARIKRFMKEFKKSTYKGRLSYLLAISLLENKKVEEGKKILGSILDDKSVSDYVKEMARSELSLLKIKERTL